jgi:hypothetical protein
LFGRHRGNPDLLAPEQGQAGPGRQGKENPRDGSADDGAHPSRFEGTPVRRHRPAGRDIDDQVGSPVAGEVVGGEVHDVIGANGADHLQLPGAVHAGDLGTVRLGDLHREGAHAAAGPVDQHRMPGLDRSPAPQAHHREATGLRHRGRLLEAQGRGLER